MPLNSESPATSVPAILPPVISTSAICAIADVAAHSASAMIEAACVYFMLDDLSSVDFELPAGPEGFLADRLSRHPAGAGYRLPGAFLKATSGRAVDLL